MHTVFWMMMMHTAVVQGERHGYVGEMANYWFWLRAEYFAKHLIGVHTKTSLPLFFWLRLYGPE